jgi:thiol-disulfide isomerase/thioredoxin
MSRIESLFGRQSRRRMLVMLAINTLALIVVIGVSVYVVTRPLSGSAVDGLTLDGETLLQEQAEAAGLPIRAPAPGFDPAEDVTALRLTDLAGRPVELDGYLGRPVWIIFWATYCHACQREEPDLRRVYESRAGGDLAMLAIDVGEEREVVRHYVEDRRLPWTVLLDGDGSAVAAYSAIGTPTHYFIDRQGIIRSRAFGALTQDDMEAHLAAIE